MRTTDLEATKIIKTYVLRVHVNCQGCRHKVKKLLSKIHGVYSVKIDIEEQLVTVSGMVNPETIIRKLANSGKRVELLSSRESDNRRETRSLPHDLSPMHSSHDPVIPTFYGAQMEDSIQMKPWTSEFGHGVLGSAMTRNRFPLWEYPGISGGHEVQGILQEYVTASGNYGVLSSGFPSYGYPSSLLQAGSQYNYPPIEWIPVASPYTF